MKFNFMLCLFLKVTSREGGNNFSIFRNILSISRKILGILQNILSISQNNFPASPCNFTKINTLLRMFFTFLKLHKW